MRIRVVAPRAERVRRITVRLDPVLELGTRKALRPGSKLVTVSAAG